MERQALVVVVITKNKEPLMERLQSAAAQNERNFRVSTPDGLSLAASRHGPETGPEVILIHGVGQSRLSWSRQTEGTLAETCRIVSYDLRGHGDSSRPHDVASYSNADLWADDLHAVIEASGFELPTLVGWSLGGLVAGHYLRKYGQDRVRGLNLVGAVTKMAPELFGPAILTYLPPLGSDDLGERIAARIGFLASCFVTPPPEVEFQRMLVFNGIVPREVHQGAPMLDNKGLDEVWAGVRHMLVTWGDEERHTRREMSRRIIDLNPNAQMSVFEGAAHAPFYERSERFNRELSAFAQR
jgi:non-heme chloroperoxidase